MSIRYSIVCLIIDKSIFCGLKNIEKYINQLL